MTGTVRYTVKDRIAEIVLNRPERRNAINVEMRRQLQEVFRDFKENPDAWVAILTGEGTTFCSGKDLTEDTPEEIPGVLSSRQLHFAQMSINKPFICALNGPCLAQGAGFAFNSDIIIMSETSSFGWPQVRRGLSSVSGPSRGAHLIPWHLAMGFLLRGRPLTPPDCLRWGLANEVVAADELMSTARRWAGEIIECAPLAVRAVKEAARLGRDLPLESRMQVAQFIADKIAQTEDAKEGIQAFKERRMPVWKGC